MSESRGLVGKVGLVGLTNIIARINLILLVPILTKTLPLEEYGVWVIITATIGLIPPAAMLGLRTSIVRFIPAENDKKRIQNIFYSIAVMVIISSGAVSLFILVISNTLSTIMLKNDIVIVYGLAVICFLEALFFLCTDLFRSLLKIKKYSILTIWKNMLNLILVGILVFNGYGIIGALLGLVISGMVSTLIAYFLVVSEIGIRKPDMARAKEFLCFSLPTVPSSLSSWLVRSSDRYIIGIFLGAAFVGYYSPAYTMGDFIMMFVAPMSFVLYPAIAKFHDENKMHEVKKALSNSVKYFLSIAIPSVFGLSLLSFPLLNIISTYEIASNGYYITPIVSVASLILGLFSIYSIILITKKRTKLIGGIWILAALLNIGLNLVLIPAIGIFGAALTTLLAFSISTILVIHYSRKSVKFSIDYNMITKAIIASLLMSIVLVLWRTTNLVEVILEIILCACIYIALMFLMRGFGRKEIELVTDLFNK